MPLAWLMAFVILIPASSHIVRGMVLCIGAEHTLIEAAEAGHHDADVKIESINSSPAEPNHIARDTDRTNVAVFGESVERNVTRCLDIPLPAIDAIDVCHQAVVEKLVTTGSLSLEQAATILTAKLPSADKLLTLPRSADPIDTSPRLSHSTVVLLI